MTGIPHTLDARLLATDNDGLEKLVVLALVITLLDGLDRVGALLAFAEDKALESDLDTFPSLVTVHGIVSADNGGNLTNTKLLDLGEQFLQVTGTGLGVGVTAITEEVDVDLGDAILLGSLEESIKMGLLGVLLS